MHLVKSSHKLPPPDCYPEYMRRSHSNDLRNGLTPGQERAIRAMLTAPSVAAAARQADVGQSTLRRWLREDDNFQTELRQIREELSRTPR